MYFKSKCYDCLPKELFQHMWLILFLYLSSSSTTHVIASNLPHAKLKELHINQNVVKPEWITDSIKEGKLLPVHSYLLAVHKTNKDQGSLNKFVKQKSSSGTK